MMNDQNCPFDMTRSINLLGDINIMEKQQKNDAQLYESIQPKEICPCDSCNELFSKYRGARMCYLIPVKMYYRNLGNKHKVVHANRVVHTSCDHWKKMVNNHDKRLDVQV